jgi:hypothetical protein
VKCASWSETLLRKVGVGSATERALRALLHRGGIIQASLYPTLRSRPLRWSKLRDTIVRVGPAPRSGTTDFTLAALQHTS